MVTKGVGVAGCGRMGLPMLEALVRAGVEARGLDIRPPSDYGASAPLMTDDPEAFSSGLRTLITVVRDQPQTEEVLFGTQGLVRRTDNLETVVVASTLSPRYVLALRERIPASIALVDAPMSGAAVAAREARLSFMLGGDDTDLDRLQPLFAAMGRHFHRMGPYGTGMAAKVLNNLVAATSTAITRLVLDWADHWSMDEKRLLSVMETSSGQNWFASGFEDIEFARDGCEPGNTIEILVKDVESALDGAPDDAFTTLPRAVQDYLRTLKARNPGSSD